MEIEYTLQKSDLMEYAATVRGWTNQLVRRQAGRALWIWYGGSIVSLLLGIFVADHLLLSPMVTYTSMALTLVLYQKVYLKRYFTAFYTEQFFPDSFAPQKLILGEAALTSIRQTSKSEIAWNSFNKIVHTPTQTFILFPNCTGYMVPRRIFKNQAMFESFKQELESKWQQGKRSFNAFAK